MAETNGRSAYFAAVNSGRGFVSLFEGIFFGESITRRYIIKGGPGTGKSSFMRRVGQRALGEGRGVEYYYCSSDTASLDGVVIDGRVAIFDGTAPHSYDTTAPGVRDEIINLGAFWDAEILRGEADGIGRLTEQKRAAYRRAYGYLRAALEVARTAEDVVSDCVLWDKMRSAVARDLGKLGLERKGTVTYAQTEAMGVRGRAYLPTLVSSSPRVHFVEDCHGIAAAYLGELLSLAKKEGLEARISVDTVDTERVREIYFPETGDVFTAVGDAVGEDCPRVNMRRFVDADKYAWIRRAHRASVGAYERLTDLAIEELGRAGRAHAEMEKYYVSAMDFSALEQFVREFLDKVGGL